MNEIITFNNPDLDGVMSLERAIGSRRSCRSFSSGPLSLDQIGQLAWAAQGQDPTGKYRTTPSAGATYPLELFVVNGDGLYLYIPSKHAIDKLGDIDLRAELAKVSLGQEFIREAPLTLVLSAEFARTTKPYGQRGVRYVYMEAGHAAQNIQLQAQAMGLGSVTVGAFDEVAVGEILTMPDYLEPIYMVSIGHGR